MAKVLEDVVVVVEEEEVVVVEVELENVVVNMEPATIECKCLTKIDLDLLLLLNQPMKTIFT